MNEAILKEILNKIVEETVKKIVEEAIKCRSDNNLLNYNTQRSVTAGSGFTMFAPKISLKAKQEHNSQQLSELYKRNNHKPRELGKTLPKQMDEKIQQAYNNYSAERQLGKMLNAERQARSNKK